jgi:cytochrome c-type biogenesis protein
MGGRSKALFAIIIIFILAAASFYFVFLKDEDDVKLERAPDFTFYDSEDFITSEQPEEFKLSSLRGSPIILIFNDIFDENLTEQNNIIRDIKGNYTDTSVISIDIHSSGKNLYDVQEYKENNGFDWYFTVDDSSIDSTPIAEKYIIVKIPTVIIIDEAGYGVYKQEREVTYSELSAQLDKVISGEAKRLNVGKLPGVQTAPNFSVTDVYGTQLNLTDYRGKVLLIDFMALWCTSCKQVEKMLHDIVDDFDEEEFAVLSIDIDPTESESDIRSHWEEEGHEWNVAKDTDDLKLKYHVIDIAKVMIVDKKGYIVYEHVGAPSESELKSEIEDAIAGKSNPIELAEISFYALAIFMGIGTFFSPCSFPMLPGYMSYYLQKDMAMQAGNGDSAEVKEGEKDEDARRKKKRVMKRALASGTISSIGIVVVFATIGVLVLFAGAAVKPYISSLGPIVGVIIIVLGGLMLTNLQYNKIIQPFQNIYRSISDRKSKKKEGGADSNQVSSGPGTSEKGYYAGLFTYGIGYGAAAAACTAPLFIAIVTQALLQLEFFQGALVLFLYILSMVILMIVVTAAIAVIGQSAVQKITAYTGHIKKISGFVLILAGIYLIWFWYTSI